MTGPPSGGCEPAAKQNSACTWLAGPVCPVWSLCGPAWSLQLPGLGGSL